MPNPAKASEAAATRPACLALGIPIEEKAAANSRNLDLLRSYAVLLVVGFHLAKFFNWRFARLRVTDIGLLGVMLFFVHTTLVLMFSLQRQRKGGNTSLFLPFLIRRCFRIYPLAMVVVTAVFFLRIPSDLQFGGFDVLRQPAANFFANLLLVQNVTLQKANPGVLWSLPLELQMYVVLPALFLFALRVKSPWTVVAFWWLTVGLWYAAGKSAGLLPLSEGGIRSPLEALLKFTRFGPCFLPGIVAYKFWRSPAVFAAWVWPVFLGLCGLAFVGLSGSRPIETGWFICFAIGLGVAFFREIPEGSLAWLTKHIARYSYGIYLLHYFAIWVAFDICGKWNVRLRVGVFSAILIGLSMLLYYAVEAPLIAVGVQISRRFNASHGAFRFQRDAERPIAQIDSAKVRAL